MTTTEKSYLRGDIPLQKETVDRVIRIYDVTRVATDFRLEGACPICQNPHTSFETYTRLCVEGRRIQLVQRRKEEGTPPSWLTLLWRFIARRKNPPTLCAIKGPHKHYDCNHCRSLMIVNLADLGLKMLPEETPSLVGAEGLVKIA